MTIFKGKIDPACIMFSKKYLPFIFVAICHLARVSEAAIECSAYAPSPQDNTVASEPRPESYLHIRYLNNSGDICGTVSDYPCGKQWYWNDEFRDRFICTNGLTCGYYDTSSYWLTCLNIHNKTMFLNEGAQCGREGNNLFVSQNGNFPSLKSANSQKFIGFGCSCGSGQRGQCKRKSSNSSVWTCQC